MEMGYRRQRKQFGFHFMYLKMKSCLNTDNGFNKSHLSNVFGNHEINNTYSHKVLSPNRFAIISDFESPIRIQLISVTNGNK